MMRRHGALLTLAGVLLVLLIAITAVVSVLWGATIDLSRWRDTAATRLSTALERPVALRGEFALTLGREATLHVGALEIPGPAGFATGEFAALGDVEVRFGLLEALRGALEVRRIAAHSARLRLERGADGRTNWALSRSSSAASTVTVDVAEVVLRNLDVEYLDSGAGRHFRAAVDEIAASDEPLRVTLRGRTAGAVPYRVTLTGGPPRTLLAATAPWPFDVVLEHAEARLAASGTVAADANVVELSTLQGRLASAEATGHLTLDLRGVRPRLRGALAFSGLDRMLAAEGESGLPAGEFAQIPVRDLVPLDVEVSLRADRLPGEIRAATVDLNAADGRVHAPLNATWAGIPVTGGLDLDTAAAVPTLAMRLETRDAVLRDLSPDIVDPKALSGELGRIALSADGRGETVAALVGNLQLALFATGRLRFERAGGAPPLALALDALDMSVRRGEPLAGRARGTLQGERVTAEFQAGTLPDMLKSHATPFEFDLAAARAKLHAAGTLAFPGAAQATDLTFRLGAPRAGDLARWLPVAAGAKLALDAHGRVRIDDEGWRLDAGSVRLGRSTLAIDAQHGNGQARSITRAAVRGPLLDLTQLATLLPPPPRAGARERARPLPEPIRSADLDLELAVEHIVWRQFDLQEVTLATRLRDRRIDPSPISARFAGGRFNGVIAGDVSGATPEVDVRLAAESIDLEVLARALGTAPKLAGKVDAIEVAAQVRGGTLRELAQRSSLTARARAATLTVSVGRGRAPVVTQVTEATMEAGAGTPVQIRVSGTYDEEPLAFQFASGRLEDLVADTGRLPIAATGSAADARVDITGDLLLPLGRGGRFVIELGGQRLDRLSGLTGVELPAWGPWSVSSPVHMRAGGLDLHDMSVRVGTSTLSGSGQIDLAGPRPRLVLDVTAPNLQLDDFPLPEHLTGEPAPVLTAAGVRATTRRVARRTERLMNAGFLRRFDSHLDVEVEEVRSGRDRLAHGRLRIQVVDGRLYLGPAQVSLPGGTLTLAIGYDPTAPEVDFKAGAYIERFDYGVLARRLHEAEGVRGRFSANLEIAGRAPSLDKVMLNAAGKIDFAIWPEDVRGGIFNLWSVNLLLAVLPVIDPGGLSHVNCIVGRFDLHDGVVRDDKMLIDTTRVRVRGTGYADLGTEKIDFVFRPRAKGLALFRLRNPLRVTGTLTDYKIGIDRRDLLPATLRMLASPILVPWEWLTRGSLPRDGADVCIDPLRE